MRKVKNKNKSKKVMCAALVLGCALTGFTVTSTSVDESQDAIAAPISTIKEFNEAQKDIFIPAPEPDIIVIEEKKPDRVLVSLGEYRISAYCPCEKCCLKSDGITASGVKASPNRTVAVDGIPFGTRLLIDGNEYIVEDRVGSGKRLIDVFFSTHEEALNSGLWVMREVFQVVEE